MNSAALDASLDEAISSNIDTKDKVELSDVSANDIKLQVDHNLIGELIYLKSELHYLLVVGTAGKDLILYNLRDAIEDIPVDMGARVHRCYWVNYSPIRKVIKTGRQAQIVMSNAAKIPVSRNNIEAFKQYI